MGRILAGCFWTWTLPRQSAPLRHHYHHVHRRLYTRDGAKKTEWTSDVAVFLLCRHHGGGPANLPRWPVKLVYQATMEIGTCCVTSEDQRGAVSLPSQYGDRAGVALLLPGRLDGQTHMAPALFLFLFLFSSSSTTYFRGSMFWAAGFRAREQGPRITVCRSDGKQGNNWWTYTVGRHSVCVGCVLYTH